MALATTKFNSIASLLQKMTLQKTYQNIVAYRLVYRLQILTGFEVLMKCYQNGFGYHC